MRTNKSKLNEQQISQQIPFGEFLLQFAIYNRKICLHSKGESWKAIIVVAIVCWLIFDYSPGA